ncbi:MAG: hypothetical protein ACK5LX_06230 [Oscillospiraceae bacterium]
MSNPNRKRDPSQFRKARRSSLVITLIFVVLMIAAMVLATMNIRANPDLGFGPWDGVTEMAKLFALPVGIMLACTVFFAVLERRNR